MRLTWPGHPIYLVCRKGVGDLFLRLQLVDKIFEVKKGDAESYKAAQTQLKPVEFEALLCPHPSLRSTLFALGLSAKLKIGFRNVLNFFVFKHRVKKNPQLPEALRQLSLLNPVSKDIDKKISAFARQHPSAADGEIPEWAQMSVRPSIPASETSKLVQTYSVKQPFVCLFPGSVWATKQWTKTGFIEVGRQLQKQGYQVVVMGGPGEEALGAEVVSAIPAALNLVAKTKLHQTLALLAGATVVISNDSAGQHLAGAADVPTVSLFGPTTLDLGFRPWNNKARVVENKDLLCRPCGKHGHDKCPIQTHVCMTSISSQEVLQKARELIPDR